MKAGFGGKLGRLAGFLASLPLILSPGFLGCFGFCTMPDELPGIVEAAPSCHDSMSTGSRGSNRLVPSARRCCLTRVTAPVALSGPGVSNSRPELNCPPDLAALFDADVDTNTTARPHFSGAPRDGTPCILCPGIASLRI